MISRGEEMWIFLKNYLFEMWKLKKNYKEKKNIKVGLNFIIMLDVQNLPKKLPNIFIAKFS